MVHFCAECGERRRTASDFALRRFVVQAFHVVTNVDTTIGRSLRGLFEWPGHLTAEHFAGRRRPYLNPLQLFLLCNVFFFAATAVGPRGPFTTTLSDQLLHHPYSEFLQGLGTGSGITFGELLDDFGAFRAYARTYDAMTNTLARSLIVLMVPLFGLVSYLLFGRSARFYAQHLVFSLHFWAYALLLFPVVGIAMFGVQFALARLGVHFEWHVWDDALILLLLVVLTVYLAEAGRRAFGEPLHWALPKALVLTVAILPIVFVYRFLLFFATWAAL